MNLREDQVPVIELDPDEPSAHANAVTLGQPLRERLVGVVVV